MAFDLGSTSALKALFACGPEPDDFHAAMEHMFGRPWAWIANEWRRQAFQFAADTTG